MEPVRAAIIGFGNVGRAVVRESSRGYGPPIRFVAAASSRGAVVIRSRSDEEALLKLGEAGERLDRHPAFVEGLGGIDAVSESGAELAFIAIPPSYERGEPNESIVKALLEQGISVVTADKTVLARGFREAMELAAEHGAFLGFRATVAAGTPATDVARGIAGRPIRRVSAVLNATTNYILTLVEQGLGVSEAIKRAVDEQLAEPDPRVDTHGWDPAAKLAIFLSAAGVYRRLGEVTRIPLDTISAEEVREALSQGYRVKYLALADLERGELSVKPVRLPATSFLASISGIYNAIEVELENEVIRLSGPAGPAWRTARVMLTDAIEYTWFRKALQRQ